MLRDIYRRAKFGCAAIISSTTWCKVSAVPLTGQVLSGSRVRLALQNVSSPEQLSYFLSTYVSVPSDTDNSVAIGVHCTLISTQVALHGVRYNIVIYPGFRLNISVLAFRLLIRTLREAPRNLSKPYVLSQHEERVLELSESIELLSRCLAHSQFRGKSWRL